MNDPLLDHRAASASLRRALNSLAERFDLGQADRQDQEMAADLVRILVRILAAVVLGRPVHRAFGTPSEVGKDTAIGKGLAEWLTYLNGA